MAKTNFIDTAAPGVALANRTKIGARVRSPRVEKWMPALLALAFLLFVGASAGRAQTHIAATWGSNTSGGSWATASNWRCLPASGQVAFNCVPADGGGDLFNVGIATTSSATVTFNANPTTIDTLLVGGLSTLQDDGNSRFLTIGDSNSNFTSSGTLTVSGTINWGDGGILTVGTTTGSNAKVTNVGAINISDATLQVNGNFGENNGTLTIGNSSEGDITGTLTSAGAVDVTGDSELIAGTFNTSGTVSVGAGSFLKVGTYDISAGTTNVAGTLSSSIFTQTGGNVTVERGATVSAASWQIFGGAATVQGQVLTEIPPSGIITNAGTLNLQDGTFIKINGNVVNLGVINTGNGVNDTGLNSLNVTGLTVSTGAISLNATGDSMTTGGLVTSGSLVVSNGTSLVDTGNMTNSGSLTISGCPLGGCSSTTPQVTVEGTLTNSGTIDIPPTEEEVLRGGITLETVESAFNSGNIGMGIVDALILFGPTEIPEPDFNNLNGGTFTITGANDTVEVGNGSWNNDAGSSLTISGGKDTLIATTAFLNGGTVTLSGDKDKIIAPSFINSGTVSIGKGETVAVQTLDLGTLGTRVATSYSQSAGSTDVNGTLFAPAVNISGGKLSGSGLIANLSSTPGGSPTPTVVTVTGGTVIPGEPDGPGALAINGSYTQNAGGTLLIDITGTGSGQFSLLDVLGAASLNGNVTFDFGFTPSAGESFTFLMAEAGKLSGAFSSDAFSGFGCPACTLLYDDARGTVTLNVGSTATPEPAGFLLMGTGLLALAVFEKTRRRRASRA